MATRIGVYTLRIMGPDFVEGEDIGVWDDQNEEVIKELDFARAEAVLTDDLPDGWYAKIEDH